MKTANQPALASRGLSRNRRTRLALLAGMTGLVVGAPAHRPLAEASSHRDSPFISEDPAADNTDVYAFVSYEPGREQYVTLLTNFVPLQEPANGPNFYRLSDFVTTRSTSTWTATRRRI